MSPARVELPEWGCVVAIVNDHLYAGSLSGKGGEPLIPVDLVCLHFLAAVNAALGADFSIDEFDLCSCEGCQPPQPSRLP